MPKKKSILIQIGALLVFSVTSLYLFTVKIRRAGKKEENIK